MRDIRRTLLAVTLILVLAYIAIAGVIDGQFLLTKIRGQAYEQLLIEQVNLYNAGQIEYIDLARIPSVEWDTVYFFEGYSMPSEINKILGKEWRGSELTGIQYNEHFTLLVFLKDENVVQHLMFRNSIAAFYTAVTEQGYYTSARYEGFSAEEAQFVVLLIMDDDPEVIWAPKVVPSN